jgi:hypothetical protein
MAGHFSRRRRARPEWKGSLGETPWATAWARESRMSPETSWRLVARVDIVKLLGKNWAEKTTNGPVQKY